MPKIRVLVVDDSVVVRRVVSDELAKDSQIEVVGTAANGKIAIARLPHVNPDLILLDVEMPEMDGLETITAIRATHPRVPIIMFSTLTERGAWVTMEALSRGATDYFTKPTTEAGTSSAIDVVRTQLVPKIKALCPRITLPEPTAPKKSPSTITKVSNRQTAVRVIAIGASTGGPNALTELFSRLPADLPVPIVITQHMPPMFTRLLAERLTAQSKIRVQEGTPGALLVPGQAWIAPGNFHMTVVREGLRCVLSTNQDPPENSCRPAVDVMFRSVATAYGAGTLAVVLTGMGHDGKRGAEIIHEAGGIILAQDEISSVVWGMPGAVAEAGLASRLLPPMALGDEIVNRVGASIS